MSSQCMFLIHYAQRAVISPLILAPKRSPQHIWVTSASVFFNLLNGYMIGMLVTSLLYKCSHDPYRELHCVGSTSLYSFSNASLLAMRRRLARRIPRQRYVNSNPICQSLTNQTHSISRRTPPRPASSIPPPLRTRYKPLLTRPKGKGKSNAGTDRCTGRDFQRCAAEGRRWGRRYVQDSSRRVVLLDCVPELYV
jgi:hypothetical protein